MPNTLRSKYAKVFKLMRLADKNTSAGEANAAIRQARKLIAELEMALRNRIARGSPSQPIGALGGGFASRSTSNKAETLAIDTCRSVAHYRTGENE